MSPSGHFTYIHATKPGKILEPLIHTHTAEPQENIDICLKCTFLDGCHPDSQFCPLKLNGNLSSDRTASRAERDKKILEMLNSGYSDKEIKEKLGIKKGTFEGIKKRMRQRGLIK